MKIADTRTTHGFLAALLLAFLPLAQAQSAHLAATKMGGDERTFARPKDAKQPSTSDNALRLKNVSGNPVSTYPLSFARVFRKGEIKRFPHVLANGTAVPTQINVKTRYDDGSIRHALIAVILPSADATLTFADEDNPNNAPLSRDKMISMLDAVATIARGDEKHTISARAMLEAGDYTVFASGPIAQTIVIADQTPKRKYDLGFNGFRQIRPVWYVEFWPTLGKAFVRFVPEATNMHELGDLDVRLTLTGGGETHYDADTIVRAMTRPSISFWKGGEPERKVNVDHNLDYLSSTGVFPRYDTTLKIPESVLARMAVTNKKVLYSSAGWQVNMSMPGGRGDIGLLPQWSVVWLLSGDWRARERVLHMADMAGSWRLHLREASPTSKFLHGDRDGSGYGKVPSLRARPSFLSVNNSGEGWVWKGGSPGLTKHRWSADGSHTPEANAVPYALTGDPFYLDQLYFWASFHAFYSSTAKTWGGRGPTGAEAGIGGDARQHAWILRTRLYAAYFAPDDHREKKYFSELTDEALATFEGRHRIAGHYKGTSQWKFFAGLSGGNSYSNELHMWEKGVANLHQTTWQIGMLTSVLGLARDMGFPAQPLLDWLWVYWKGMQFDPAYNPHLAAAYHQPVGPKSPWFAFWPTWKEVYDRHSAEHKKWVNDWSPPSVWQNVDHGYPWFAASAYAQYWDKPEGREAWEWWKTKLHDRARARLEANPKLAIVPRENTFR